MIEITSDAAPELETRISRPALHTIVADRVREMIVNGTFASGARLNEKELCDTLGVSRTPLREAIKVLEAESLVTITPNRGASVTSMSQQEIEDAFELLSGLETFGAELACERMTDANLEELRVLTSSMLKHHRDGNLAAYYEINRNIHLQILRSAGNDALFQTYVTQNRKLEALRFRSNLDQTKWDRAVQDHCDIISALDMRDTQRLCAIMRNHILTKRDAVLAVSSPT